MQEDAVRRAALAGIRAWVAGLERLKACGQPGTLMRD